MYGKMITEARESAGKTRLWLAKTIGVPKDRLLFWERDMRNPSLPMLERIALALGVRLSVKYEPREGPR